MMSETRPKMDGGRGGEAVSVEGRPFADSSPNLDIKSTAARVSAEEAAEIARKQHPDIITRMVQWVVPSLRSQVEVIRTEPFYCSFHCGVARLVVGKGRRQRTVTMGAAMPGAARMVRVMAGEPEWAERSVPLEQVVEDVYGTQEARLRIGDYLRKVGYRRLRSIPTVELLSMLSVYKPFYHCLCTDRGKTFSRVVDAEVGERDYLLELLYKKLRFKTA